VKTARRFTPGDRVILTTHARLEKSATVVESDALGAVVQMDLARPGATLLSWLRSIRPKRATDRSIPTISARVCARSGAGPRPSPGPPPWATVSVDARRD
jgi:hypothetical protein